MSMSSFISAPLFRNFFNILKTFTLKASSKFSFILTASININIIVTIFVKKNGIENQILKNSPNKNVSMVNINNTAAWYSTNFETMLLNFLEVILSFNFIAFAIPNIVSKAIAVPTDINSPWIGAKNNRRVVKI